MQYIKTLTIAGSDSGGSAGIQADLKTFAALGCYGMSVITALTAQNTLGVQEVFPVAPSFVEAQLQSIVSDIGADAIKIGMLHRKEVIEVIAKQLPVNIPVILDPVMIAKGGSALLKQDAIEAMRILLFPRATLITPNIPEAEALLGYKIANEAIMQKAAKDLCRLGSKAVLLKGGHLESDRISDCLYVAEKDQYFWFPKMKIKTENTHGTGCTLSAAITAYLAKGNNLVEAVTLATDYLFHAIGAGKYYHLGHGHGPVHHFYALWRCSQ